MVGRYVSGSMAGIECHRYGAVCCAMGLKDGEYDNEGPEFEISQQITMASC